jgi:hypothetical protein
MIVSFRGAGARLRLEESGEGGVPAQVVTLE